MLWFGSILQINEMRKRKKERGGGEMKNTDNINWQRLDATGIEHG